MADESVVVSKVGSHFIFDFDIVVFAQVGKPSHTVRHTDKPLVKVEVVW